MGKDRRSRKGWKKCNVTDHQRPLIPSQSSLGAVASVVYVHHAFYKHEAIIRNVQLRMSTSLLEGLTHTAKNVTCFYTLGYHWRGFAFQIDLWQSYRAITTNLYKTFTIIEAEIIASFIIKLNGQVGQWIKERLTPKYYCLYISGRQLMVINSWKKNYILHWLQEQ